MQDAATLEAIACCEALSLAEDLGLQSFITVSDAKQVVSNLENRSRGRHGVVISEIISRAASFTCNFTFEGRSVNEEAH